MRKRNIAILMGGDSEERVISIKTAAVIQKHLHSEKLITRLVDISGSHWTDTETGLQLDKNDFSLKIGRRKLKFDLVFAAIHGAPIENGALQGYFEMLGIPYTCCSGFVSALTMDKHITKAVVAKTGAPLAPSFLVRKGEKTDVTEYIQQYCGGYPVFIKPNKHGSSFGVTKVKRAEDVPAALEYAYQYDNEVLVEQFMPGREFGQGAFRHKGKIIVLPLTEIIPKNEFFDFAAKYEGASTEVTPAQVSPKLAQQAAKRTHQLYEALGCRGVVRFDYILVNGDTFQMLEVNTIPGMSEASIVPQQVVAYGWTLKEFFTALALEAMRG